MPYPRFKPAPVEEMEKKIGGPNSGLNTICATLREMYRMTDDPEIKLKCRIAFSMGKAMCRKLGEYHERYGPRRSEYIDGI